MTHKFYIQVCYLPSALYKFDTQRQLTWMTFEVFINTDYYHNELLNFITDVELYFKRICLVESNDSKLEELLEMESKGFLKVQKYNGGRIADFIKDRITLEAKERKKMIDSIGCFRLI